MNFSLFLAGQTGVFKTALAALCQQHVGTAMDDRGLPTNFASTGNALQELASTQKTRHWSWTTLPRREGMAMLTLVLVAVGIVAATQR